MNTDIEALRAPQPAAQQGGARVTLPEAPDAIRAGEAKGEPS